MSQTLLSTLMPLSMSYYPTWVIWLFFILTIGLVFTFFFAAVGLGKIDFIGGIDSNGLKRHFFFKAAPYKSIIFITACISLGFIFAVLLMIIIGGVSWLLLWLVKILCYTIYYIGLALLIIGILCLLGKAKEGLVAAIPGGLIVYWGDPIKSFAELCVEWGENIWTSFNIFDFAKDILFSYWSIGLGIALTPISIFLIVALLWMIFAFCLRLYDWGTTKYYSIHHPCPYCQENSEPALYYSNGMALKTDLRPGVYGLFHIVHPTTKEKMPTLLLNGRSTLVRKCCRCGSFINIETGVDKHIAMVGGPGSGKSSLSLTMLGKLKAMCNNLVIGGDVSCETKTTVELISKNGRIKDNEFPNKTAEGVMPSLRVNIEREGKPPYALYINDIAGELFQPGKDVGDALKFLYNTTSVVFLIDPTTAILHTPGTKMKKWIEMNKSFITPTSNLEEIYASVRTYINEINRLSKMTINYVLVKTDTGYLGDIDTRDNDALKQFVVEELGIPGILSKGEFAQECFLAVSTTMKDGNVDALNKSLLEQQNIILD